MQADRQTDRLTSKLIEAVGVWLCVEAGAEQRQHGHFLDLVCVGCYREIKETVLECETCPLNNLNNKKQKNEMIKTNPFK